MDSDQYGSWKAYSAAYKAVARNDQRATVDAHLRFAVFDRFLCRVFADQERDEWLLKGGTALLARVPDSRATKDVDLVTTEKELDEAQEALIEVAQRDLGDHVEFHFKSSQPTGGGENQPNVQARQLTFVCSDMDTGRWIGDVKVDLEELRLALEAERVIRGEPPVTTFRVPDTWGVRFSKLARETPACSGIADVEEAVTHVRRLVEPGLSRTVEHTEQIWRPGHGWQSVESGETGHAEHG